MGAILVSTILGLAGLAGAPGEDFRAAAASLKAEDVLADIKALASDEFEGRGPGTPGEEKTVAYLIDRFKAIGLKPGNPDGRFVQDVPLVGFQATMTSGSIRVGPTTINLKSQDDWVAVSRRFAAPEVKVNDTDVVFVGCGVVAPEYGWDDYKDVDVRGKTIVMLINDPAVPDPAHPEQLDSAVFKGRAMTYYGRWTYKYEIASQKGAAAALIVHETGPAGYPFQVVVGSWGRENFDIPSPDGNASRVAVEGWLSLDRAKELFKAAGQDFDALKMSAASRSFRPVDLHAKASFEVKNTSREVMSKNVVAKLEGSDPRVKDEVVVYTAHWDHLGRDPKLTGDQIFNGAADNASGVAAILEVARGFTRLKQPPRRSILFLAVTAEEKGLLGAKYYATHPLYPLSKTLADLNMDVINLWGRTKDVVSVGLGNTTLDDLLTDAAATQDRFVADDPEPEKGMFYRSDHFEFAKQGVPALNLKGGMTYLGKPADYGKLKRDEYTQRDYHKVTDEVKADWDLSGALEDLRLLFEVGYQVAQGEFFPAWKPGTEFKAVRDASLQRAGR
jgi:Zn-dependent M28 family amino/carboxypeptidase